MTDPLLKTRYDSVLEITENLVSAYYKLLAEHESLKAEFRIVKEYNMELEKICKEYL